MNSQLIRDSLERVAVTAALAGIGVAVTEIQGWDVWWAVALAAALNIIKVAVASRFGDPNTGGFVTEPGTALDPASREWLSPTGDEWAASQPDVDSHDQVEVED